MSLHPFFNNNSSRAQNFEHLQRIKNFVHSLMDRISCVKCQGRASNPSAIFIPVQFVLYMKGSGKTDWREHIPITAQANNYFIIVSINFPRITEFFPF